MRPETLSGGAASPSMDDRRTTAAGSALSSFRLMRAEEQAVVTLVLFCVAPVKYDC